MAHVRSVWLRPALLELLGDDLLGDGRRAVPPPLPQNRLGVERHGTGIAAAAVVLVAHPVVFWCLGSSGAKSPKVGKSESEVEED